MLSETCRPVSATEPDGVQVPRLQAWDLLGGEWWPRLATCEDGPRSRLLEDVLEDLSHGACAGSDSFAPLGPEEFAASYGQQIYSHATVSPHWDVAVRFGDLIWNLKPEYQRRLLPHVDLAQLCAEVEGARQSPALALHVLADLEAEDEGYSELPASQRVLYRLLHERLWGLECVSQFVPTKALPSPFALPRTSAVRQVFQKSWELYGGVPHFVRLLALHADFALQWLCTTEKIMSGTGPLLPRDRYYIALLACATHDCTDMTEKMEFLFTQNGGDPNWLQGVAFASPKMQQMAGFNTVLAHSPWKLHQQDIAQLLAAGWSRGQAAHAVLIASCFHALCGFLLACGVIHDAESGEITAGREQSTDLCQTLSLPLSVDLFESRPSGSTTDIDQVALDHSHVDVERSHRPGKYTLTNRHNVTHYKDFDAYEPRPKHHRVSEFNWNDGAFGELSDLRLQEEAAQLQLLFEIADRGLGLTVAGQHVDTSSFRRMVWLYVHYVYGVVHDDFDYRLINTFFQDLAIVKIVKGFIKRTACCPETCDASHFHDWGYAFSFAEKVHLAVLCCEARKQAELIHGLRAISEAFT